MAAEAGAWFCTMQRLFSKTQTKALTIAPTRVSCTEEAIVRLRGYRAPWWARNAHVQTVTASRLSQKPVVNYQRNIWQTPDDDVLAVDEVMSTCEAAVLQKTSVPIVQTEEGLYNVEGAQASSKQLGAARAFSWLGG